MKTTTTTRTGADLLYDLVKALGDEASFLEGLRKVNERKAEILDALSPGFRSGETRTFIVSPSYEPRVVEVGYPDGETKLYARFLSVEAAFDFTLPSDLLPAQEPADEHEPLAVASSF